MFTTREDFRDTAPDGGEDQRWRRVDLTFGQPLVLVRLRCPETRIEQTTLMAQAADVLDVAMQPGLNGLLSIHLLQPPKWSPSGNWSLIEIVELGVRPVGNGSKRRSVIFKDLGGSLFGGYPIVKIDGEPQSFEAVISLPGCGRASGLQWVCQGAALSPQDRAEPMQPQRRRWL
ncbi:MULTISPECIES: hypothetical protein [Ramlibacter]|uniref:Uncharacterized protein n=1 Tax=Ramlibacter aquaticus TaxID=2780094 RepID=A0ABR9SK27_9BURK|nr:MULTISPECIES: hypothetical protein [Ramlibacter]MBE7942672.1 hypothetical protein [Ramlibacter aquaticus]